MKRGSPMKRTPMRRTGRLRSRRMGHKGTVAGRSSVTPARWQEIRTALYDRHGNRCCVPWCRRSGLLDPQHVKKRSQGGADDIGNPAAGEPGNLVPLCRRCHDLADNAPDGPTKLHLAPVSSDPPLACGFYVRQGDRSGFISLLAAGGAIHETF